MMSLSSYYLQLCRGLHILYKHLYFACVNDVLFFFYFIFKFSSNTSICAIHVLQNVHYCYSLEIFLGGNLAL